MSGSREEAGEEASRQDRGLGLGQGEDMAAWSFRGVRDGDAALRRPRVDSEREVAGAVMPPQSAVRSGDEQSGEARDRRERDAVRRGEPRPPKPAPKMPNRFWDGCPARCR